MDKLNRLHVIACGVLAIDFKRIGQDLGLDLSFTFLEGGLHSKPMLLKQKLQESIDTISAQNDCCRIIIGYGLCGNGAIGICARNIPLVIPRVHDCIALFLGSDQAYKREFAKYPGTYYISAGWYQEKVQPQGQKPCGSFIADKTVTHSELVNDYGEENAAAITEFVNSWQKNYQRAAFINTSAPAMAKYEAYAKQMAQAYGWKYEHIDGDCQLLKTSLLAAATTDDILVVPSGHVTLYDARLGKISSGPPNNASADSERNSQYVLRADQKPVAQEYSRLGLGIDAGGTYTDAAVYDFASKQIIAKAKALTTKWNYSIGISETLSMLPREHLHNIDLVSVSTTLATNAIVEGHGSKVGLLLMPPYGIFDPAEIAHEPKAVLRGKLDIDGTELQPVDPQQISAIASQMMLTGVTAFAVSGYAGTVNPEHELAVKQVVKQTTGASVTCGHELSDMLDFKTRAATAILNARIIGKIETFLQQLKNTLQDYNINAPVMVVKGDGTLMSGQMAALKPVETILSGPAASVAGARYLTGLADAVVVDMGGTTTDTAAVKAGLVRVHDSGTRVGGHKTHVKALEMRTVGLGGDSAVDYIAGDFKIGPRRVGPVCWMASKDPRAKAALDFLETRLDDYRSSTEPMQFFILSDPGHASDLTTAEQAIIKALSSRPCSLDELTSRLGLPWHTMLHTERLEAHHIITRCGLTPTDILHVTGEFDRWDAGSAHRLCDMFAQICGLNTKTLVSRIRDSIIRRLTTELLKKKLDEKTDSDKLDSCAICQALLDNMFHSNGDGYKVSIRLDCPVIGVGAPARFFVPQAAAMLSTNAVIPEHADVANAIGAISSDVLVRRTVRISTDAGAFVTEGLPGAKRFAKLEDAHDYAVDQLAKIVRLAAAESGTSSADVSVSFNDIVGQASDGLEVYLGREIKAELSGRPDVKIK